MNRYYIQIDPDEKNRKITLDQAAEIVLTKASGPYSLILELPDGTKEKIDFEAYKEYIVKYDKDSNSVNTRSLIGDSSDISLSIIA